MEWKPWRIPDFVSFPQYKQMLVCQQQEIIFYAISFPVPCRFAVMLFLDDNFLERETRILENPHNFKAHRDNAAFLAGVTHKYRAKLARLQYAKALTSNGLHLRQKLLDAIIGQPPLYHCRGLIVGASLFVGTKFLLILPGFILRDWKILMSTQDKPGQEANVLF